MEASATHDADRALLPAAMIPKGRRRWLQFSLRSLIFVTLIGGVASGRLGRFIEEKIEESNEKERLLAEQRKAWEESHKTAATLSQWPGVMAMVCSQLRAPNDVYVEISYPSATDDTLLRLVGLRQIGSLHVRGSQVTDAGVRHLASLTGLQHLMIHSKKVTDASLAHLHGLTNLRGLDLKSTSVTDAGVNELRKALPNCDIYR
jgi:hypothetical protein